MSEQHALFDLQTQVPPSPVIPAFVNTGCWEGKAVAFDDGPNIASAHLQYIISSCMNVDWLHQLLKGLFKYDIWAWIVGCLKDIHGQEKVLGLWDKWFSITPSISDICRLGDKCSFVNQWTSVEYQDTVKDWVCAFVLVLEGHPEYCAFIKFVTDCISIICYHSITETVLKYLQHTLSGISSNIHLFLPYHNHHSICSIPRINSLLHYIQLFTDVGSANNSDSTISEAIHKYLIKNGYCSTNKGKYILQMLWWETCIFHIKSKVRIQPHIIKSDSFSPEADIFN